MKRNSIKSAYFKSIILSVIAGALPAYIIILIIFRIMNQFSIMEAVLVFVVLFCASVISVFVGITLYTNLKAIIDKFSKQIVEVLRQKKGENALKEIELEEFQEVLQSLEEYFQTEAKTTQMYALFNRVASHKAKLANIDDKTGLYNTKFLHEFLPYEIARSSSIADEVSIVMMDIDYFKNYNDTNGHQAGDEVLIQIADILKQSTRNLDIPIRFGGEEFLIIMPRTRINRAHTAAERIRNKIESARFANEEKQPGGKVTASFGVANMPNHAKSAEELIRNADLALYMAKESGRNRVVIYDEHLENSTPETIREKVRANGMGSPAPKE